MKDSLKPKPTLSRVLLGVGSEEGRDPQDVSIDLLHALSHLLKLASLDSKMSEGLQSDDSEQSSRIRAQFSHLLERNLMLVDATVDMKPVSQACGDLLGSLLGVLSLVDFLDTVGVLLQRPNDELRRKVLRLLESRLRRETEKDSASQAKILSFLSTLTQIIEESSDVLLKHAAVACIDRISDKYGKKDRSKVVETAKVISGKQCIGQTDDRIRVMGVLCLASMAEVLGQAIIPVLPQALPQSFNLLEMSLEQGKENYRLHDAVFSLISALLEHVPFMILDTNLDNILKLSFKSASSNLPEESIESRREVLGLVAKRVDVRESFGAILRNWSHGVSEGPEVSCSIHTPLKLWNITKPDTQAAREALEVISTAIEKHPKSSTVKNVDVLFSLLNNAFDLRRMQSCPRTSDSYEEEEIEELENLVNNVTIKMIYKLNDTTFRPLFAKLTEWATSGLPEKDAIGKAMRLTTFYKFLNVFFATLKVSNCISRMLFSLRFADRLSLLPSQSLLDMQVISSKTLSMFSSNIALLLRSRNRFGSQLYEQSAMPSSMIKTVNLPSPFSSACSTNWLLLVQQSSGNHLITLTLSRRLSSLSSPMPRTPRPLTWLSTKRCPLS